MTDSAESEIGDQDDDDLVPDLPDKESLGLSLRKALDSTPKLPRDRAAVRLAMHYAGLLDDIFDRLAEVDEHRGGDTSVADINRLTSMIAKIGPRYEATLDKLGMAPGARPALRGGDPAGVSPAAAALGALQRGAAPPGFDPAAAVDPAVAEADAGD